MIAQLEWTHKVAIRLYSTARRTFLRIKDAGIFLGVDVRLQGIPSTEMLGLLGKSPDVASLTV